MATAEDSLIQPPNTYTLVLPPGWARIPLRYGTEGAVRRILDRSFAGLPRDEVFTYRRDLEAQLGEQIAKARADHGLDLYLPVELVHGITLPASFLVAEFRTDSVDDVDPAELALFLATSEPGRRIVQIGGASAVRTEITAPADPAHGAEFPSRRVEYQISVPGDPNRWLTAVFSTVTAEDPEGEISSVLVELFDAVMTTLRWSMR
ncbi:hypothetical protein AB5J72_28845 [Streptomyces sp. CG1]|uniref:hypothetical protein n=1 Tax=Streptomyces sp. CG1 TaxID=1287523 RepID=UPI0034E2C119